MSKPNDLDATDLAILRLIQADASLSLGDIRQEVGLKQTTVAYTHMNLATTLTLEIFVRGA